MTDFSKDTIEKFLVNGGVSLDGFVSNLRDFFEDGRDHYRRVILRNRIASRLGLDVRLIGEAERKQLWTEVKTYEKTGSFSFIDKMSIRTTVERWSSGEFDPPLLTLLKYFENKGLTIKGLNLWDDLEPTRYALSRTLSFLMVYPWRNPIKETQITNSYLKYRELHRKELAKIVQNHQYNKRYIKSKRKICPINQSLLDAILCAMPDYAIEVRELGQLKLFMETKTDPLNPWFIPYGIFMYATFEENTGGNPLLYWLWDECHELYNDFWNY